MNKLKNYLIEKTKNSKYNSFLTSNEQVSIDLGSEFYVTQGRLESLTKEGFIDCFPTQDGIVYKVIKGGG